MVSCSPFASGNRFFIIFCTGLMTLSFSILLSEISLRSPYVSVLLGVSLVFFSVSQLLCGPSKFALNSTRSSMSTALVITSLLSGERTKFLNFYFYVLYFDQLFLLYSNTICLRLFSFSNWDISKFYLLIKT